MHAAAVPAVTLAQGSVELETLQPAGRFVRSVVSDSPLAGFPPAVAKITSTVWLVRRNAVTVPAGATLASTVPEAGDALDTAAPEPGTAPDGAPRRYRRRCLPHWPRPRAARSTPTNRRRKPTA